MAERAEIRSYLTKSGLKLYQLAELARVPSKSLYRFMKYDGDLKLEYWRKIEKLISKRPE